MPYTKEVVLLRCQIRKLYKGCASLRSDRVEKALKKGEGIRVCFNGEHMDLSAEELSKGRMLTVGSFKSKYNPNQRYSLIDYRWQPKGMRV